MSSSNLIVNQADPSTRLVTTEKCDENIKQCRENLRILKEAAAPKEKINKARIEKNVWERTKELITKGETITINDQQQLHWIPSVTMN
jgi:hypothetical protein